MSCKLCVTALLLVMFAVAGQASFAQAGPPLITDDPGTPGNKQWEINLGFTVEKLASETIFETPLLDVNYGAGDHLQLKFEMPYVVRTADQAIHAGLGNSKIGVKWRFLDESGQGVSVSTYPQFTFNNPTTSVRQGLADDGWQMFLPLECSKTFRKLQVDGEAGYNLQRKRPDELWLGLVAAVHPLARVELLGELHSIGSRHFSENESVFDLGSRIKLTRLNTLLFAAGRSLPGSVAVRFFTYAGVQFTF